MDNVAAIVLAAGEGTRLKSKKPKVAHEIFEKPLVEWVIDAAEGAGIHKVVTVVGHEADQIIPVVSPRGEHAFQERRLGTADAVMSALRSEAFKGFRGSVVVLSGDCPLIRSETIEALCAAKEAEGAAAAVLTMELDDPFGYGRIIREAGNSVARIVEQKDASEEEAAVCECNSGFYCFDASELAAALEEVGTDNAQGEYYLTDVLEIMQEKGLGTIACLADDPEDCLGINSRKQLAEATKVMQRRINETHMAAGVTMMDPDLVWIGPDVTIEPDAVIHTNVSLMGKTSIGEDTVVMMNTHLVDTTVGDGCSIGPNSRLYDTRVGNGCTVDETISYEALIDDGATTGPRAYLRPGAHLCEGAKAGTHVEIKKSTIGKGSKVPHLSYIGDTTMGENINIGAGSITCNYDGKNKHATTIGDNTFVGSDTMMVAPVNIGKNVIVGAGSVITKDIPDDALAVARAREKIFDEWVVHHRK